MENKKHFLISVNIVCILLIIATSIALLISPTNTLAFAEESLSYNWNYPSSWTKIGGDQNYKALVADSVYTLEFANENSNGYQSTGVEHPSININEVLAEGTPSMSLRRTFLKGYFENSWYIAVLVDVIMNPSNKYNSSARIRSANVTIDTQICEAVKLGSSIITYWPSVGLGGYLQEASPYNIPDSTSQTVNVEVGATLGQNNTISTSFSVSNQNSIPRLLLYSNPLKYHDRKNDKYYDNGFRAKFLYYHPSINDVPYTESASVLKYCAIYRCDEEVDVYDLKVNVDGQFFFRSKNGSTAIAKTIRNEDFYIKPSTNFFKTYYVD